MDQNFIENELLIITKPMMDIFLKQKDPSDLISLYMFYYYTAKWQKTNQAKAHTNYTAKGLGWTENRVRRSKKILINDLKLIKDVQSRNEEGKIKEWYIKINYIFRSSTEELITHPVKKQQGGLGNRVVLRGGNAYNADKLNAYNADKLNEHSENALLFPDSKKGPKINPEILSILKEIIPEFEFTNKLPDATRPATGTLARAAEILEHLYSHKLSKVCSFSEGYLQKHKINLKELSAEISSWADVKRILRKSLNVFKEVMRSEKWIKKPPKDISNFLYNSHTQTSWFLFCLFSPFKTTKKISEQKIKDSLTDKETKAGEEFIKKYPEFNWYKISELKKWLGENKERLNNEYGSFAATCGNLRLLLECISEFVRSWKGFNIGTFGVSNGSWLKFSSFMKEKKGIDFNFGKKKSDHGNDDYNPMEELDD